MDKAARPKILLRRVHESLKNLGISAVIGVVLLWLLPSYIRYLAVDIGAIVFIANVIYTFVVDWKPKGHIEVTGKAVVISGCDSGFGYLLAQRLDDLGFQVFAGCLFPEGDGAKKLKSSASNRLHIVKMDVTKDQDITEAVAIVDEKLGNRELWAVVCNAGFNEGAELDWTDLNVIKNVLEVNMLGVVRLTKAFLPKIISSKGRVVAVASAAGRYTYPGMVPYCMSKCAVISFCDGLRLELSYRWGIKVITVEPWTYRTNITNEDTVLSYVKRTWDRASEEIKNKYPDGYSTQYAKSTLRFLNFSASNRPSDVVACMEEAITAINPKYAYNPGKVFSRVTFWFLRRFPKPIADFLILDSYTVPYGQ